LVLPEWLSACFSVVLQHLHVLEACGLVRSEKTGRVRTCHIDPPAPRTAEDWIARQRTAWERRLDDPGGYLAEHPSSPEPGERTPEPGERTPEPGERHD
jgi:hypothetical protein